MFTVIDIKQNKVVYQYVPHQIQIIEPGGEVTVITTWALASISGSLILI